MFDATKKCPFTALKKACATHDCALYLPIRGKHPQTGQDIDEFGCAIAWQLVAQFEGNLETRQAAAAVESFRNEMKSDNAQLGALFMRAIPPAHHVGQVADMHEKDPGAAAKVIEPPPDTRQGKPEES